jgi:hypothetical protein
VREQPLDDIAGGHGQWEWAQVSVRADEHEAGFECTVPMSIGTVLPHMT